MMGYVIGKNTSLKVERLKFPVVMTLQNKFFRNLVLPSTGKHLMKVGSKEGDEVIHSFKSPDDLRQVISYVEQLCGLNDWDDGLFVTLDHEDVKAGRDASSDTSTDDLAGTFKDNPDKLSEDQLFEYAESLGIKTRKNNTREWLVEHITEVVGA